MAITPAQHNEATSATVATTHTCAYASAQTAGNLNVVHVVVLSSTITVSSVTDSIGNVYSLAISNTTHNGGGMEYIYYCLSIASAGAGANTVTAHLSSTGAGAAIWANEWTGVSSWALGPVGAVSSASNGTAMTASSLVVSAASYVQIAGYVCGQTYNTTGTGWTKLDTDSSGNGLTYQVFTTSGTRNSSATQNISAGWDSASAVFYDAGVTATLEEHAGWMPTPGMPGAPLILASDEEFTQQPVLALEEMAPWSAMPAPPGAWAAWGADEELPQQVAPPPALDEYAAPPALFALAPSFSQAFTWDEELPQPPPPPVALEEGAPWLALVAGPGVVSPLAFDEELAQFVAPAPLEEHSPAWFAPAPGYGQPLFALDEEFALPPVVTVALEEDAPTLFFLSAPAPAIFAVPQEELGIPTAIAFEEYAAPPGPWLSLAPGTTSVPFTFDEEWFLYIPPVPSTVVSIFNRPDMRRHHRHR